MKKLIVSSILATSLFADSLTLGLLGVSKHSSKLEHLNLNENHNYFKVGYHKSIAPQLEAGVVYQKFKNSYSDKQENIGVDFKYLPLQKGKFKAGVEVFAGQQKGYDVENFNFKKCNQNSKCKSFAVIPSLYFEYGYFYTNITGSKWVTALEAGLIARF